MWKVKCIGQVIGYKFWTIADRNLITNIHVKLIELHIFSVAWQGQDDQLKVKGKI